MPRNKDQKRIIRNRMKKTGESYTAARAQILATASTSRPPVGRINFAGLAGTSDETIAAKTGRTWREWVRLLDADEASSLRHRDIASLVHDKHGVSDWWSQMVTVGYERIKGLRERGQRRSGEYEANKSRTFAVPVGALYDVWYDAATRRRWIQGVDATVRTGTRPKSIRLQWPDGTIVIAGFEAKGTAKSMVAVTHTKLRDRRSLDNAKKGAIGWRRCSGCSTPARNPKGGRRGVPRRPPAPRFTQAGTCLPAKRGNGNRLNHGLRRALHQP